MRLCPQVSSSVSPLELQLPRMCQRPNAEQPQPSHLQQRCFVQRRCTRSPQVSRLQSMLQQGWSVGYTGVRAREVSCFMVRCEKCQGWGTRCDRAAVEVSQGGWDWKCGKAKSGLAGLNVGRTSAIASTICAVLVRETVPQRHSPREGTVWP